MNKPFNIKGIHESLKDDFESGLITLEQAAFELFKANWTPFVDIEYT